MQSCTSLDVSLTLMYTTSTAILLQKSNVLLTMLYIVSTAISIQKAGDYKRGGQYDSTEQWKKDEILAAKIKKFLSVSSNHIQKVVIQGNRNLYAAAEANDVNITSPLAST